LAVIAVLLMAVYDVVEAHTTIGDFVLINVLLFRLFIPLSSIGNLYRQFKRSLVQMQRMFNILDTDVDVGGDQNLNASTRTIKTINFEHISCSYDH
jgi:ATP-binding cassette subfamily B protein